MVPSRSLSHVISVLALWLCSSASVAQALPGFDFTTDAGRAGWRAAHDVSAMQGSPEGLAISISGVDPYIHGPARDYPENQPLWLTIRLKSERGGMGQVFYFKDRTTEEDSVRFFVQAGKWEEHRLMLPSLGKGYRLRFDPPGDGGTAIVASITFEPRVPLKEPAWIRPVEPMIRENALRVVSGELALTHSDNELGGFVVSLAGQRMAIGCNRPMIGYIAGSQQKWIEVNRTAKVKVAQDGPAVVVSAALSDPDGANWNISQRFSPASSPSAIDVETRIALDQDRQVVYAAPFMLSAGVGSFGPSKTAALFPGLEYLDKDEPSSSEADIIGPGSRRQVPDSEKITFPLMTVLADGRYVGLIWQPRPELSAVFDSPDRLFNSGGHVMGLIYPGSDGTNRIEGNLLPHGPRTLGPKEPLLARATIIGGESASVMAAVQQYVAMRGWPDLPQPGMDLQGYVKLAAAGWMDSMIREGNQFKHAVPGKFPAQPCSDAAMWMEWAAANSDDAPLKKRLSDSAAAALAEIKGVNYDHAQIAHVRYPVTSLLFGHVKENAATAKLSAKGTMRRFEADGTLLYRPGEKNYGKTHFAKDADGLTATSVWHVLESASLCGDRKLIDESIRLLRAMDKFAGTAPRGAQTWECPLHTPDILASGYLVKCYVRGYELTGDAHFLEMAKYWAWTGVPFVYLVNPTDKPIGPYATIAVFGATNWVAPNWMGMPVQWCGLVYSDALYRLAAYDEGGPWKKLAEGITISGIQQSFPIGDDPKRVGLLPDSFIPRIQRRNDPAINPGTVQANAAQLFNRPVYSFHAFRQAGLLLHAPGSLRQVTENANGIGFKVSGCIQGSYFALISGCTKPPAVRINGLPAAADVVEYVADEGWLILHLKGDAAVELHL